MAADKTRAEPQWWWACEKGGEERQGPATDLSTGTCFLRVRESCPQWAPRNNVCTSSPSMPWVPYLPLRYPCAHPLPPVLVSRRQEDGCHVVNIAAKWFSEAVPSSRRPWPLFAVIMWCCSEGCWTFHLFGHRFCKSRHHCTLAYSTTRDVTKGLASSIRENKKRNQFLKVKTVLKGQILSSYKSMQQYSLQESLRRFRVWPENNSNHRIAAMRWKRMIRSSPLSLEAGPSGYTECFVLRSVKLQPGSGSA